MRVASPDAGRVGADRLYLSWVRSFLTLHGHFRNRKIRQPSFNSRVLEHEIPGRQLDAPLEIAIRNLELPNASAIAANGIAPLGANDQRARLMRDLDRSRP